MHDGPFVGLDGEILRPRHHHLGDFGVLWVFGVGIFEKHAKGEEGRLYGLDGGPAGA